MKSYLRIISYSKPYSSYVPAYLILTILAVIFGSLNFILLMPILEVLFQTVPIGDLQKPEFQLSMTYAKEIFYYYMKKFIQLLIFLCILLLRLI